MQLEKTTGAPYAAAKTDRGGRLRRTGQGETLLAKLTFRQERRRPGAPNRTEANLSKLLRFPEFGGTNAAPRTNQDVAKGGLGGALATNLTYHQRRQSPRPN